MKIFLFIVATVIVLISIFIGFIILTLILGMYAFAAGLDYKARTENEAWNYWETIKYKKWDELTSEEKEKCVSAVMVIYADCGACSTEEEVRHMLAENLPILESKSGPPIPNSTFF